MSRILIDKAKKLLERETGTIYSPLEGKLKFALAFPGAYRLGMSALGFQIIYRILNSLPGAACERVFLPEPADEREFMRSRTRLFSLESQTPLADFDVLAFSISYELDYVNVVKIIELAGLPVFASDRDESHPLIIAGGPCATFNPEPLAEIIDAFVIGDGEEVIGDIVRALEDSGGLDRADLLAKLAQIPSVYVPRFYTPSYSPDGTIAGMEVHSHAPSRVTKRVVHDLERYPNQAIVLTPDAEFSDMLLAEVMRGCKRHCRFCVAGHIVLPPRPRQIGELPEGSRVGLVGSSVFDHPEAHAICESLTSEGQEFSISSTRIESLSDDLARMMYEGGQRTLTIAPEAGTERLRWIINKPITDDEIMDAARMASEAGFPRLKLYFMVGLPGETPEDVDAIPELAKRIAESYPSFRLQISASCYVPKPWTPFQWCGMAPEKELSSSLKRIKNALKSEKRIELSSESPRSAYVQAWLARGDRRLGKIIAAAAAGSNYAKAASEAGIDTDFYASRPRGEDEIFPWDHIDLLIKKDYLRKEFTRALEGQITTCCNVGACTRCGVC
ncbi:MAG: TIGR03960 family B12-binding radical SAM protein [Armatimonadota bacterium]